MKVEGNKYHIAKSLRAEFETLIAQWLVVSLIHLSGSLL